MCIVSNWVNEALDLMAVTKYDDLPNSLIPSNNHPQRLRWNSDIMRVLLV